MSLLESINDARHALAHERSELAATIAADLARLDLCDRLLAPGTQPFAHSGQNQFPAFLTATAGPAMGSRIRRLASRLLTAGG